VPGTSSVVCSFTYRSKMTLQTKRGDRHVAIKLPTLPPQTFIFAMREVEIIADGRPLVASHASRARPRWQL